MKVLIIEDSESLRRSLSIGLRNSGFTVDVSGDGAEGLTMALTGDYNLLILDLMLPSIDGMSILKAIRSSKKDIKILILSAKDFIDDKVDGLLQGADDYLTKPFSFEEVRARLLSLMRRSEYRIRDNKISIGEFSIDLNLKQFLCKTDEVTLTPNEYKIMECLFTNQNKIISPEKMSEYLVGDYDAVSKNSLEAHISSLRKKINIFGLECPIKNRRGFGYFVEN